MVFLSMLLRQNVYDLDNCCIGTLYDVYVDLNETFPVVTGLIIQAPHGGSRTIVPWTQVQSLEVSPVRLTVSRSQITPYKPHADELLLKRDILDKQIVDTQGFRVVKVNDLQLAQIKRTVRLIGVDISFGGLLRRLGWKPAIDTLSRFLPVQFPERTVTWNYVEPIQRVNVTGQLAAVTADGTTAVHPGGTISAVQLNVSRSKLAELHPADIADILEQLDVEDAGVMLDRLDMDTAADTLNEVETPLQAELLSELGPERASSLLEKLPPDDVADILADMPSAEAERLLNLLPKDDAQSIRGLLRYNAETAGGIMTPEVLALAQDATVEDALNYLRQHSQHLELVYYLYVVDSEQHLKGVVSLRQLVTAEPTVCMQDLMDADVIKVQTTTDQEHVADVIAKYDLFGVPVVDEEEHLVGVVTVDDVIDVIHREQAEDLSEMVGTDIEEAEEEESFSFSSLVSRFSWLVVNAIAGFILAIIISRVFGSVLTLSTALAQVTNPIPGLRSHLALSSTICLIPMLLLVSGSAGSQALGIAGWRLRPTRGRDFWRGFFRQVLLGTIGGILVSLLAGILILFLFHSLWLSIAVGLGFSFTLLIAYICGLSLPNLLQRLRLRGSLITAPLLDPVIAVISVSVFLAVTLLLIDHFNI